MEGILQVIPWDVVGYLISTILALILNKFVKKAKVNKDKIEADKYFKPAAEVIAGVIKHLPQKLNEQVRAEVADAIEDSPIKEEIKAAIKRARRAPWSAN